MKRSIAFLVLVILLTGGAIGAMSGPSSAQGYYPATPYVGNNTPWTFYRGDWFLNGILYYFFGPKIGFAPYYSYPQVYIVRPNNWYAPGWNGWYQAHPQYWNNFERQHPEWRGHQMGRHYDQNFYNRYHNGQGAGWNKGFQGVRTPGGTGTGFHPQGTTGTGFRPQGATGTATPGVHGPVTTTGARPAVTGTGVHPSGTAPSGGTPAKTPPHEERHP